MCGRALEKRFGSVREAFSQPKGGHNVSDFKFEWFRAFVVIRWHVNELLFRAAQVKVNSFTAQVENPLTIFTNKLIWGSEKTEKKET